ncbi:MAG: phosphoglycerate kinase [Dehalococcoidia bacterium]
MKKQSVRDIDVRGKRVLVRVDFNVPMRDGAVADDARIQATLPTLQLLLDNGAAVIACSHLGRPGGRVRKGLRMGPVAEQLAKLLERPVQTAPRSVGREVEELVKSLQPGEIMLLENLRFHPGEEANERKFAQHLAKLADIYVNDAFGAAHRAHASTEGVARLLPSAAGLLMENEVENLAQVFGRRRERVAVVSGGAKVSDKLGLLKTFAERANVICIGGAMANTFLLAGGTKIGASLAEPELVEEARAILAVASKRRCEVRLPVDGVIAQGVNHPPRARPILFEGEEVPDGWQILDVGPRTIEQFKQALAKANVIIWNGPLGLFEREAFAGGTRALAQAIAGMDARTVVCGGETLQAVREAGVAERMTHLSSGGAAALELLEGRELPGLAALPDAR